MEMMEFPPGKELHTLTTKIIGMIFLDWKTPIYTASSMPIVQYSESNRNWYLTLQDN